MTNKISAEFIEQSICRINENTPRIIRCLNELSEEEIWLRPNPSSNSIGNLIFHLCGNITQYILSSLGNTKDERDRDKEFSATEGLTKDELKHKLVDTVNAAVNIIQSCTKKDLKRVRDVQGFQLSGIGIIIHVTEHYSYHTGQIAFRTKQLKNIDLKFYDGVDLNVKNKNS